MAFSIAVFKSTSVAIQKDTGHGRYRRHLDKSPSSGPVLSQSQSPADRCPDLWSLLLLLLLVGTSAAGPPLHLSLSRTCPGTVFRSLKSELGLRPIYHQRQQRSNGHLFITVKLGLSRQQAFR